MSQTCPKCNGIGFHYDSNNMTYDYDLYCNHCNGRGFIKQQNQNSSYTLYKSSFDTDIDADNSN